MRASRAVKGLALAVLATLGAAGCRDFSAQTYCAAHPELCQMQVREVTPASSYLPGGMQVRVQGTAFDPDTRVVVGGVEVATEVVGTTELRFVAPAHEAGAVDLVLKSAHQTVTVPGAFTYLPPPQPQVDTVIPARGSTQGDTPLTLSGHGFAAPLTVLVGGVACTHVTLVDESRITARAPARSAGPQDVQVVTPYGSFRAAGAYTSVEPWHEMNQGLEGAQVLSVSVHPADGAVVLAGTRGGGLFRSADQGRTWARVPGMDAVTDVRALAHDAASGTSWAATAQGVFRGTDAGASWTAWNTGLPGSDIQALVVRSDGTVFVGLVAPLYSDYLYQLDPGASAWKRAFGAPYYPKRGLAIGAAFIYLDTGDAWGLMRGGFAPYWDNVADRSLGINTFAVVPGTPDTVYVGARDGLSALNPDTKTRALLFTESPVTAVRVDPAAPGTLYLGTGKGLRVSLDAGATWTPGPGGPEVKLSALDVAPDGTVHAGTEALGVLSGGPEGPLAPRGSGLTAADVLSLAVDGSTPERVYAITATGLFRSGDGASTWSAVPGTDVPSPRAVWADPTRAGIAYVATAGGLYRTRDGGATWAPTGLTSAVRDVALATSAPGTLYAAMSSGVWRSDDSGDTWSPMPGLPSGVSPVRLAVSPHDAERLFADDGLHVYLRDAGTWTQLGQLDGERLVMAVSPVDDRLYLLSPFSLWVGDTGGLKSIYRPSGVPGTFQTLGFTAGTAGTLYVGTLQGALYLYTPTANPDTPWTRLSSIPAAVPVLQVVSAPSAPDVVYVGTRGRGVLKSTIGGL